MGHPYTHVSGTPTADDNGYVILVDMKVGDYGLAATFPPFGARHVTCKRTITDTADTGGTLVITGTDLSGGTISETLTVGADGVTVTGTKLFATVSKVTGAGWVIDAVQQTKDQIIVGWDNVNAVATSSGTLHAIVINTTATSTIVVTDAQGTIATIPASVAVGTQYLYDVNYAGFLRVECGGASDITVIHSGSMPGSYSM